ncbi:hypothetical protein FXB41_29380 [Bradyrhizobium canariense]|nr:hypothetical protein [Bradyrhizobium canariense]
MSQSPGAMVECIFGWGKQHGTMRKNKHWGIARVAADFLLNLIAYNLIRIQNCSPQRRPISAEFASGSACPALALREVFSLDLAQERSKVPPRNAQARR